MEMKIKDGVGAGKNLVFPSLSLWAKKNYDGSALPAPQPPYPTHGVKAQ